MKTVGTRVNHKIQTAGMLKTTYIVVKDNFYIE